MGLHLKPTETGDMNVTDGEGRLIAQLGRGTTDTDNTYLALKNADGETAYITPHPDQNAAVVSATKP